MKPRGQFFGELAKALWFSASRLVRSLTARASRLASARAIWITGSVLFEVRQAAICEAKGKLQDFDAQLRLDQIRGDAWRLFLMLEPAR